MSFFAPQGQLVTPIHVKHGMWTVTCVCLAVQNFTSIGAGGCECGQRSLYVEKFLSDAISNRRIGS